MTLPFPVSDTPMVISRTEALKLVANHDLVAEIPAILPLVERYAAQARALTGTGCKACQLRGKLAPLGNEVLAFLLSLPAEQIEPLRVRLRDRHLYVFDPGQSTRSMRELGAAVPA